MAPRTRNRSRRRRLSGDICIPVVSFLALSVLFFLLADKDLPNGSDNGGIDQKKLKVLEQIETLFPKDVIELIKSKVDLGSLSLNTVSQKDLPSSWVLEKPGSENGEPKNLPNGYLLPQIGDHYESREEPKNSSTTEQISDAANEVENQVLSTNSGFSYQVNETAQILRRQLKLERKMERLIEITQQDELIKVMLGKKDLEREKEFGRSVFNKYSIWTHDNDEHSDYLVRLMRDQLTMAHIYIGLARLRGNAQLLRELRQQVKESQHVLGEAIVDAELPESVSEQIKVMGREISIAREKLFDCSAITKKLRAMVQWAEEQGHTLKKQNTFLSQLASKTIPKGLHCLSLRLTIEYSLLPKIKRGFSGREKLKDNTLFHYALFSDNVLAASVVVNSTVLNAKEPEKHVFHLVTDKLNYAAMKMWFLANPPGPATIEVQNIDHLKWLNSSYCPVLHQLESASMKEYYLKADQGMAAAASNLKYRNPKYLSMLNHIRFYLPQMYPELDKILFLDNDIVVQRDLTALWSVDLRGNVNGAVETCGGSFYRFNKYLNFSNPLIAGNFDPNSCVWAYGMNIFDLKEWKKQDITGIYHKWQNLNEDWNLWKLGTLPVGLITFYNMTYPLAKFWHVLGLGYNPSVEFEEIESAAVIHYNGNMKPWLELGMARYKPYWTRYVKYDHIFLRQCNIG